MTRETDQPSGQPSGAKPSRTDLDLDEDRIAAGLAELAAAADLLRALPLDDEEPEAAFDPAWPDETPR
jgi:hypothetical protein